MSSREEHFSNLRRIGRLYQTRRDWSSLKNKKENSKQINRIQTHRGTVREQVIPKNINPLKTIRRRSTSKKGGRGRTIGSNKKNCKTHHRHTKSCRRS